MVRALVLSPHARMEVMGSALMKGPLVSLILATIALTDDLPGGTVALRAFSIGVTAGGFVMPWLRGLKHGLP